MEEKSRPYIKISEEDARSCLPQLRLRLQASNNLYLTLPFPIQFTIEHQDGDALAKRSVIFEWVWYSHGFSKAGFVLLHHKADGLELIAVDHSGSVETDKPMLINEWNHNLWELNPEGSVTFQHFLPANYQSLLKAGETYTLLWPGGKAGLWEYGTVREHVGHTLEHGPTPLTLPGGPYLTFSTYVALPPWPMREEREARCGFEEANWEEHMWRYKQNRPKPTFPRGNRPHNDPNAPNLCVSLECQSSIHAGHFFEVAVTVTYDAHPTARPITFHTYMFEEYSCYSLGRLCNGIWMCYEDGRSGCCGFRIVDDPDVSIKVGENSNFISLGPGASWTTTKQIGPLWAELPEDAKDGEVFRYMFDGYTLEWWDWGSKADHAETVVKLPCWIFGQVVDPEDNDGRPRLAVQPSNVVEFTFVEKT